MNNDRLYFLLWIVLSVAFSAFGWKFPQYSGSFVYGSVVLLHGWSFVAGMLIAQKLFREHEISITWKVLLLSIAVTVPVYLFVGSQTKFMNEIPRGFLLMEIVIIFWVVFPEGLIRFLRWVSTFSYEWYLVHMLVVDSLFRLFRRPSELLPQILIGLLCIVLSGVLAWLYHRFLNKVLFSRKAVVS